MAERFLLSEPVVEGIAKLVDEQAHHLARVMRAKQGDLVGLFDGLGNEYEAEVREVSKKHVTLEVRTQKSVPEANQPEIIVACSLPKGDRQKYLIEKLVELGANCFIPLKTSRSVAEASEKVIHRIEKQVVEASKQCRRSWLMKVRAQTTVDALIESFKIFDGVRMVADPYAQSDDCLLSDDPCVIAIGPEGGFSDDESHIFETNKWTPICFSPNVLRIETAATAAVAILRSSKSKHNLS